MFFEQNKPYARVTEAATGRVLLVQGDVSVWDGWPPSDAFDTPSWAKGPATETQIPLDSEERAASLLADVKHMKDSLKSVAAEVAAGKKKSKT